MDIPSIASLSDDFLIQVALGNVNGYSIVHKFGSINDVGSALTAIATAKTYKTPTSVTALEMVSDDNTNDTSSGSGAQQVTVYGLNSSWVEISETVTLNGTTAVALANSYFRIYRMKVTRSGTYASDTAGSHNSTITLRVASAGATWAEIAPESSFGLGQSQIGAFTIPSGKVGLILTKHIKKESAKNPNVYFFVRENADDVTTPYTGVMQVKELERNIDGSFVLQPRSPLGPFTGPADIGFLCNVATGTADLSVDFEILLVDI